MSQTFPESFWMQTATKAERNPSVAGELSVDVAIVGAGFTGLRAALMLADSGANVVVLDGGDVGWGASGRTGGQVNPMLPFNTPDELYKRLGSTYFERLTNVSLNSADELFNLIKDHKIDCQARQNGWLRVNHNLKAQRLSVSNAEVWNKYGAGMELVDAETVRRLSGTRAYQTGVIVPKGGAVQPLSLARGLARVATEKGAKIFGDSSVSSLTEGNGGWVLKTSKATINAQWVVLATNGYTDSLFTGLASTIMPLVPIQIATDALDDRQLENILPKGHTISDSRRIIMYARREPGNQFIYGGLGRLAPSGKIAGFDWLVNDAERVFPVLKGVHWKYRWGGKIALTSDHLPHLHEPKNGLIAGLGYNGRGVAMSNVVGRIIAERVLGAEQQSLELPITDIKKYPFKAVQMVGKGAVINWMRFLDFVETRA